jgi:hypothetical protein
MSRGSFINDFFYVHILYLFVEYIRGSRKMARGFWDVDIF